MSLELMRLSQIFALSLGTLSLSGCGMFVQPEKLEPLAAATYSGPSHSAAKRAYLQGYKMRYDVPKLEYPPEIVQRVRLARIEKLRKNQKLLKMNMKVVRTSLNAKYVAGLAGKNKTAAEKILDHTKEGNYNTLLDASMHDEALWTMMMTASRTEKGKPKRRITKQIYKKWMRMYPSRVKGFKVDDCTWRHMKELIGSGYDDMGFVYGERPIGGYKCSFEANVKTSNGAYRIYDGSGFFIKSEKTEQWLYFGGYVGSWTKPRRLKLNSEILKNPEKAIDRLPFWKVDI